MGRSATANGLTWRQTRELCLLFCGLVAFVAWLYRPQSATEAAPSPDAGPPAADAEGAAGQQQILAVSLSSAPNDPVELAAYDLSSAMADEKAAVEGVETMRRQVAGKRSLLRAAEAERDALARTMQDAVSRSAAMAAHLPAEQTLLVPLRDADRQAQRQLFDAETERRQADRAIADFQARVAELSNAVRAMQAERGALQGELDYLSAILPQRLANLREKLRRQGELHLLLESVKRSEQREQRDRVRNQYEQDDRFSSRQSEAQLESARASFTEKYVDAEIDACVQRAHAAELAKQSALGGQITDVDGRLALHQEQLDRQQEYLDEAWELYETKQAQLEIARRLKAETAKALQIALEQLADRRADLLAAHEHVAGLQPALAAAEANVQQASREVDRWVGELSAAQEKLQQARAATGEARAALYAQKAAQTRGGFRTALNLSF